MRSERRAARIAVDLLGGDTAPAVVVDGALLALRTESGARLLPVGPRDVVDSLLARVPGELRDRIEPVPSEDGTAPVRAAAALLAAGAADAVVSAGATAATVTAAVAGHGRYPGLTRPALAVTIPAVRGPLVLLDVGASPNVTAADLVRHAVLGAGYAAATLGARNPLVGLLSIGTEPGSGDSLRRSTDQVLRNSPLPIGAGYQGPVEGHDVLLGGVDVVVTDGFTGNVLLKGIEGVLRLRDGADLPAIGETGTPHAAVLLGVPAPVVVCHGAASGSDLASGISLARRLVDERVPEQVALVDQAFRGDPTPAPGGVPT